MIHINQSVWEQIIVIFNRRKTAIGLTRYSVGELLDHGGMSNVYRIIDGSGNTDYVLRVSEEHKSPYSNDVFNERELRILQELKKNRQPHVVQFLDAFIVDMPGQPRYYCSVMKFLITLNQYHVEGDGAEIAVRLGCDFLPLLQSFMDRNILHRDIKPENIFFDRDFRNDTGFLLGDFGIAKRNTLTSVTPIGTESTMAPEVRGLDRALGNDRTFGDMYSLGMVMYMYLNQGIYPSNSERIDRMPPDKAPFPEPRYGSRRLKKLVLRATSYDPKDRFESPQAMLRELQNCVEYKQFIGQTDENSRDTVLFQEDEHEEVRRLQDENEQLRQIIVHAKSRPSPVAESGYSKSAYHLSEKDIYSSTSKTMSKQNIILLSAVGVTVLGLLLSIGLWLGSRSNAKGEASSASVVDTQKLVINEQPESVTTRPNKLVRFKVVASGTGLKYQWYYRKKGISSWSKWRIYYTAEIEPPANETWDGLQVRCKVTDCEGNSVYSEVASVTLIPYETGDFMITQQPKSFKVKKSEVGKKSLQFSVKANGKDMKYQWYFCKSGETAWTLWDERTSSSFKAVPNNSWDGILIYCKITNYDSEELYSNLSSVSFTDD